MSRAHIVKTMPAKKLSEEQRLEAANLKALFRAWQAQRKEAGKPWTQDDVSDEFGFGQSALSQYLGGLIPLNPAAVAKFAEVLGVTPMEISPTVVKQVQEVQERAAAFLRANERARTTTTKPRRRTA